MGRMDGQVLRRSQRPVSNASVATDHPQCSESFGRKQHSPLRRPMAGNRSSIGS